MKDKDYEQLATKIMMNALEGVKAQIRKAYDKGYKDGKADTPFTDTEEKALSQEPCDDAISRQAVLDKAVYTETEEGWSGRTVDVKDIEALPPVTPQQKYGKWVLKRTFPTKLYDEYLNEYKCSECYRQIRCTESQLVNYPYCHCGAKMQESE